MQWSNVYWFASSSSHRPGNNDKEANTKFYIQINKIMSTQTVSFSINPIIHSNAVTVAVQTISTDVVILDCSTVN